MQNFQFSMPTQVFFGKGEIEHLPSLMAHLGKRVLLTYGGGSIKKMGIYHERENLYEKS